MIDINALRSEQQVAQCDKSELFDFYHKHFDAVLGELKELTKHSKILLAGYDKFSKAYFESQRVADDRTAMVLSLQRDIESLKAWLRLLAASTNENRDDVLQVIANLLGDET